MNWWEIIIYVLAIGTGATVLWATLSLAPWLPARRRDLERIRVLAALQPGEIWYELGAGDGRVSGYIARRHPASRAVGLELSLPLYAACKARQLWRRNLSFRWRNAFTADLRDADVVYMFGLPKTVVGRLQEKLSRELKPGARVLSYSFEMKGWKPDIVDKPTPEQITVYRYVMPASVIARSESASDVAISFD